MQLSDTISVALFELRNLLGPPLTVVKQGAGGRGAGGRRLNCSVFTILSTLEEDRRLK
jgi:hypothetical protein